jgi:prephenate dehydrogenase
MNIGIIGFGRFGQLLASTLSGKHNVAVTDIQDKSAVASKTGARFCSLPEVCKQKLVVLCVPISQMESVLLRIKGRVKKGQVVMDICSVKEYPAGLMLKHLPGCVEIIACHPMFGPDGAKEGLTGLQIVFYNLRAKKTTYRRVIKVFRGLGLKIIEMTPEEHDKQNAVTLALSYFIGRAFANMDLDAPLLTTLVFERLKEIGQIVSNDSDQLFRDMQTKNRFAKKLRKEFMAILVQLDRELN